MVVVILWAFFFSAVCCPTHAHTQASKRSTTMRAVVGWAVKSPTTTNAYVTSGTSKGTEETATSKGFVASFFCLFWFCVSFGGE